MVFILNTLYFLFFCVYSNVLQNPLGDDVKADKDLIAITEKLLNPGPVLAGKVRTMTSVCGKPGCKCMRKDNPEKHPYNQLSYTKDKKTKTMYVKKVDLDLTKEFTENYKELRQATLDLGRKSAELIKTHGINEATEIINESFEKSKCNILKLKQSPATVKQLQKSRNNWKSKALDRQSEINKLRIKVRDLEKSRDGWKTKAMWQKTENNILKQECKSIKKN